MELELDKLEKDILIELSKASQARMHRKDLLKKLKEKYVPKPYSSERSLDAVLARKIDKLRVKRLVGKEDLGHMKVYYFIPKKKQESIKHLRDKEGLRTFVEKATPEQISTLRGMIEQAVRDSWGTLGWALEFTWSIDGHPSMKDPLLDYSSEQRAVAVFKNFSEFMKENCNQCPYYINPDDPQWSGIDRPRWCKALDKEISPGNIPASLIHRQCYYRDLPATLESNKSKKENREI